MKLITDNNTGIMYRIWKAENTNACFLLVHGLGAHSERWKPLAENFNSKNISVYAIELKGFGETPSLKGHIDSFETYYKDIYNLYKIICRENRDKEIFILGESMGALISFQTVQKYPGIFKGLICLSPAFQSRIRFPLIDYLRFLIYIFVNSKNQFYMPFKACECTRDAELQTILDNDQREHRFASVSLLCETIKAQVKSLLFDNKISVPVLFQLAGTDKLVNPASSKKVFSKINSKNKKLINYPQMYHALSIDLEKEKVFEDIFDWINDKKQF